jgi:hypothetical protein
LISLIFVTRCKINDYRNDETALPLKIPVSDITSKSILVLIVLNGLIVLNELVVLNGLIVLNELIVLNGLIILNGL